uniref:Uncharacterized protein n=1 Tax=Dulem virus 31 TaxID=3145749 RepID=A0AAU8AT56_9VIRU
MFTKKRVPRVESKKIFLTKKGMCKILHNGQPLHYQWRICF